MNKWLKFAFSFMLVIAALSVIGLVLNIVTSLLAFAFKLFVFGSIGYGIYYMLHKTLSKNERKTK